MTAQPEFERQPRLFRLSNSGVNLAVPGHDIRGRKVIDRNDEEIGVVDDLFIDPIEKKVRFLEINSGGLLGIGTTEFLIPVDAVTTVNRDVIKIDQPKHFVIGGPTYDPAIIDERYWGDLYDYYGVQPYWQPGYVYPPLKL